MRHFLTCPVRRKTYGSLFGALVLALLALAFVPHDAQADAANPIAVNQPAPELIGSRWLNTPDKTPVTLASRKGKVTILHFWTYGCINCKHNLPSYARLQKEFAAQDVAVIGVHTPETPGEASPANVRARVREYGITYPVLIDAGSKNWQRWDQQFWPTVYLLDRHGRIRYRWEGELEYDGQDGTNKVAGLVRQLLKEK